MSDKAVAPPETLEDGTTILRLEPGVIVEVYNPDKTLRMRVTVTGEVELMITHSELEPALGLKAGAPRSSVALPEGEARTKSTPAKKT